MQYRLAEEEDRPRCVEVTALSEGTQQRLRALGAGDDAVLVSEFERGGAGWAVLWGLVSSAGVAAATWALLRPFGSLEPAPLSVLSTGLLAGGPLGVALFAARQAVRALRLGRGGMPRGVFVLAHDVIDTRRDAIRIFPTSSLERLRVLHGRLLLSFPQGAVFDLPAGASASKLAAQLESGRQQLEQTDDEVMRRRLDPLLDERGRWPADAPLPPRSPAVLTAVWAGAALALGVAIGVAAVKPMRHLNERRGIQLALDEHDDVLLRDYISRGGAHAALADQARLTMALRDESDDTLYHYLSTSGVERSRADEALFQRQLRAPTAAGFRRYLDAGGIRRSDADARLLGLLEQASSEEGLRAYLQRGGLQAERVRRLSLPLAVLRHAVESRHFALVRRLARGLPESEGEPAPDPEVVTQATQGLRDLYASEIRNFHARLVRPTPLSQALEDILRASASPEASHTLQVRLIASPIMLTSPPDVAWIAQHRILTDILTQKFHRLFSVQALDLAFASPQRDTLEAGQFVMPASQAEHEMSVVVWGALYGHEQVLGELHLRPSPDAPVRCVELVTPPAFRRVSTLVHAYRMRTPALLAEMFEQALLGTPHDTPDAPPGSSLPPCGASRAPATR